MQHMKSWALASFTCRTIAISAFPKAIPALQYTALLTDKIKGLLADFCPHPLPTWQKTGAE